MIGNRYPVTPTSSSKHTLVAKTTALRQTSTLQSPRQFVLSKERRRQGFYAIYNQSFEGSRLEFHCRLVSGILFPWTRSAVMPLSNIKPIAGILLDQPVKRAGESILKRSTSLKGFEFTVTLAEIKVEALGTAQVYILGSQFSAQDFKDPAVADQYRALEASFVKYEEDFTKTYSGSEYATACGFTEKNKRLLASCVQSAQVSLADKILTVKVTFIIAKDEAEYLNSTALPEIKLGNFYSMLVRWFTTLNLNRARLPEFSSSITKVSKSLQSIEGAAPVPRVGPMDIVVQQNGLPIVIPQINAAESYEQQLQDCGLYDDGSYSYTKVKGKLEQDPETGELELVQDPNSPRLPQNMPVLTDWVNFRFAYANTSSNLATFDLSTTVPLSAFHIRQLLTAEFDLTTSDGKGNSILSQVFSHASLAVKTQFQDHLQDGDIYVPKDRPELLRSIMSRVINTYDVDAIISILSASVRARLEAGQLLLTDLTDHGITDKKIPLHVFSSTGPVREYAVIGRIISHFRKGLEENLEVAYRRLSPLTVLGTLATLRILDTYKDVDKVIDEDRAERDAYLTQGTDPDYVQEGLPNIANGIKYMPHQNKAANLLRRGPKFAILEVDAGGGKTICILSNILKELRDHRCVKPIILCPPHLVAQYVEEAVYVTEGKLNVIPVTNASLKIQGEERLTKMIQHAPINSVVVSDFDFLKRRSEQVGYGSDSIEVCRNVEFLRKFNFDIVFVDESHYLKNIRSGRRKAAARFMLDIPMKRLASGTLVNNVISDVASQAGLFDPSIFGTTDQFNQEFGAELRGDKVMAWKSGAAALVKSRLKEHCVIVTGKRKEWAALLPPVVEKFIGVDLTDNQRLVYESVLQKTLELIEDAKKRDPAFREALEEGQDDDSRSEDLERLLRPYMQRLERFLSAPDKDPLAKELLRTPEDLLSPKVKKIYERCHIHLDNAYPGKILIFTSYVASARAVYNNAPPELKSQMILYSAARKVECKAQFENDSRKTIMVGVENSMNTGLNLQMASRLIRMETVWTPGQVEQGMARINRPQLKKKDIRTHIYLDWIVTNRSVDITKASRLISKLISKAKFDENENPDFQVLPDVPQIAMSVDSIASQNDFREELVPYLEAYQGLQQAIQKDYAAYREANGDKLDFVDVPNQGVLPESKLMSRVPYIPGMDVYGSSQLGLVRYDAFITQEMSALDSDKDTDVDYDTGEDEGEDDDRDVSQELKEKVRRERELMRGRPVHTEFGDGTISTLGPRRVWVDLAGGGRKLLSKTAVFLITRADTNGKDMRSALLKLVGKIPLDQPINDVPLTEGDADRKRKMKKNAPEVEETNKFSIELDFTIINDYLAITYDGADDSARAILSNHGFQIVPQYYYTRILGPRTLLGLFKAWSAKGFTMKKEISALFKEIYQAIKSSKSQLKTFGFASSMELKNYFRLQQKPTADQNELHPFPIIQDGKLYLGLWVKGQAATKRAIRVITENIKYHLADGDQMIRFVRTKPEAKAVLQTLLNTGSIDIANLKALGGKFKQIRLVQRKDEDN